VLSIAEILHILHKTDVEEKFGKGTTIERLKSPRGVHFYWARNLNSGLEILPYGRNFCPWTKDLGAGNS
jgi:hypothetical protein